MSLTNLSEYNPEDVKLALKLALVKLDIASKPFIVYVNPKDEQALTKALGDLKEQALIKSSDLVEAGKAYIALRRDLIEPDISPLQFNTEDL